MALSLIFLLLVSAGHLHGAPAEDLINQNLDLGTALTVDDPMFDGIEKAEKPTGELLMLSMEATDLPVKDPMGGLPDAYVQAWYTDVDFNFYKFLGRTSVVYNNQNPVWNNVIMFRIFDPTLNQVLKFDLKDFDKFSVDDNIGTALFNINTCIPPAPKDGITSKAPAIYECTAPISSNGGMLKLTIVSGIKLNQRDK